MNKCEYKNLSPQTLAFLGDSVFDLFIRESLIYKFPHSPVRNLHDLKIKKVCATSQSKLIKSLLPLLNEEEMAIYKRGRNCHTAHTISPNFAYRESTALECLIGYLYLKGDINRLKNLIFYFNEGRECIADSK